MNFNNWKKTASKTDTSYIAQWRESKGKTPLTDRENDLRFDRYLLMVEALDQMIAEKRSEEDHGGDWEGLAFPEDHQHGAFDPDEVADFTGFDYM